MVPYPSPQVTNFSLEELLSDYRDYLVRERGLVDGSVQGYESVARRFLSERARGGDSDLEGLVAADVTNFVQPDCRRLVLIVSATPLRPRCCAPACACRRSPKCSVTAA